MAGKAEEGRGRQWEAEGGKEGRGSQRRAEEGSGRRGGREVRGGRMPVKIPNLSTGEPQVGGGGLAGHHTLSCIT